MSSENRIDRWKLVEDIFNAAVELPVSNRGAFLARACGDDNGLRSEVESLLENDNTANTATIQSIVERDLRRFTDVAETSEAGERIGPYRLVRQIDRGGMGAVYLAVRSDDHYFQIVALKMVRKGMESAALLQRFRAERQILATLTHPNIGAILDGGDSDDGRPYLVMEYVEGQPITLAIETRSLSIRQRIELFRSLCSAVHYAHQRLVIHRDIKPSNVMVTSEGIVKLIDFGIAKPLAPELIPGEFAPTEIGHRPMTPDYASPEQVLGRSVTPASDIYSLGVLLFELLTGSRPYTVGDISPAAAEKVVCEQENRTPSAVRELSRRTRRALAGDLDTIVLKAMEKDPPRRYATALDLGEDSRRFLEGKPILAKRTTLFYRLDKSIQRHRTACLMAAAASIVVIGSFLLVSAQAHAAHARMKQIEALADSAVSDMTEKLQQSSASVDLQASLFHSTLDYLNRLRQDSGNDPRLLLKLSKAYGRVGDLEGSPFSASLANPDNAIKSYREALRTALAARTQLPGDESSRAVIEAYQQLGQFETFAGRLQEARELYQRCLPIARESANCCWSSRPPTPGSCRSSTRQAGASGFSESRNSAADANVSTARPKQAEQKLHMALGVFQRRGANVKPSELIVIPTAAVLDVVRQSAEGGVAVAGDYAFDIIRVHHAN